jgi:hypothetical protein
VGLAFHAAFASVRLQWRGGASTGTLTPNSREVLGSVVRAFTDVVGASGEAYRFHRADLAGLPHMAGNFLFTRFGLDGLVIVGCGSSNDMSVARALWGPAEEHFADAVYLRLDIVRQRRSEVVADIAARHQPAIVAEEFDRTGQAQISAPREAEIATAAV